MRPRAPKPGDELAERFGLTAKELTPRVRAVVEVLLAEIGTLKAEVEAASALADRDPLIPVLNRRAFLEALQRATAHATRYGEEAAVLYIDLDAFKSINDNFGHPTGDAALRHIGRILLDSVRESDVVGRMGGDEFAVILARSNIADARRKAATLARTIESSPCVHEGLEHRLSASIGVHAIGRAEDAEAALARADEAMYASRKRPLKRAAAS